MLCPNCGKENQDGVKFCRYCGGALGAPQQQMPPQQQVPPQQFQQPPQQTPYPQQQPPVQMQSGGSSMIAPKNVSPFAAAFLNYFLGLGYFYIGQHATGSSQSTCFRDTKILSGAYDEKSR